MLSTLALKNFILAVLIIFVSSANAYNQKQEEFDKIVYNNIMQICQSEETWLEMGLYFVNSMKFSFKAFSDITTDANVAAGIQVFRDRGLSPTMSYTLQSEGLFRALRSCYPNSEQNRDRLILGLILADTAGRGVGTIQGYLLFIVPVVKVYKALRASKLGLRFNMKRIEKYAIGTGIGILGYKFIQQYLSENNSSEETLSTLREIFTQISLRIEGCQNIDEISDLRNVFLNLYTSSALVADVSSLKNELDFVQRIDREKLLKCQK